jgi:hypothetical protein
METEVKSKRLAALIAIMIDARLIWYKHYYGWADDLIMRLPEPPLWIIELATIKYDRKAIEAIGRFVQAQRVHMLTLR